MKKRVIVGAFAVAMVTLSTQTVSAAAEVILDYIGRPITKILLLILNAFVPFALGAGAIFAVLLVNFGV